MPAAGAFPEDSDDATAHTAPPSPLELLPAQFETLGDEDLARVIMSLPPAMAAQAISAGLLDSFTASAPPPMTLAPDRFTSPASRSSSTADASLSRTPAPRATAERVFAPTPSRRGSAPEPRTESSPTRSTTFGTDGSIGNAAPSFQSSSPDAASSGTNSATSSFATQTSSSSTSSPRISRAPLDRAVSLDSTDDSPNPEFASPEDTDDEPPAEEPDLDRLADEVFDILRWRLVSERERAFR